MSKVLSQINRNSESSDIPVLLWLLKCYRWSSEFGFVANAAHIIHPEGKAMMGDLKWYPTPEGRLLYKYRDELLENDHE
jgi:hypothetical protein